MHFPLRRWLLIVLLSSCGLAQAQAPTTAPKQPPEKLLRALSRGVNLSIWFTYRGTPGIDPALWYPAGSDWQQIKDLGLSHVRVQFDPAYFRDPAQPTRLRDDRMAELKRDLAPAWAHGLVVVLALEPMVADKSRLVKDEAGIAELAAFWQAFAKSMKSISPKRLVFELLNEPTTTAADSNRVLMQRLVDAVRVVAPRHTLVVEGHGYSGIEELTAFEPLPNDNLIYSFHFYDPGVFTHQGATWSWEMFPKLQGMPYPSSPEAVVPLVAAAVEEAKPVIVQYGEELWDRARIEARIERARVWQQAKGVAIWCGEFGASRLGAPEADRHVWLADVRQSLEARGIPWAMWDYVGHFALFSGNTGAREVDLKSAEALGLLPPSRPAAQ